MGVAPRVIIINAYSPPLDFFRYVRAAGDEAMDQFIRRLAMIWKVVKYDPNSGDGVIAAQEIGKTKRYEWVRDRGQPYEKKVRMGHGAVAHWAELTTGEATLLGLVAVALACPDIGLMPQDVAQQQQVRAKGHRHERAIGPGKLGEQLALEPPADMERVRVDEQGYWVPIELPN